MDVIHDTPEDLDNWGPGCFWCEGVLESAAEQVVGWHALCLEQRAVESTLLNEEEFEEGGEGGC